MQTDILNCVLFFLDLKKKCNEAESAYQIVKRELESTKEDMCRLEEDQKWYIHIMMVAAFMLQRRFDLEEVYFVLTP
jgi:purine nucleoside permease